MQQKPFPCFDRTRLNIKPLSERHSDLDTGTILGLADCPCRIDTLAIVADRIKTAKAKGAAVILMMGAHVIRAGVQRYLIDLLEKGYIDCIAMNGAGVVHDFEFAFHGATTENVSRYIGEGQFGLWQETGLINEIVTQAAESKSGLGEAVGRQIAQSNFPHRDISLLAAAYRAGVLATVHVGIGYDITHELPNCSGAAYGDTSYRDFLRFARIIGQLEQGVVMNFGCAVMAPEIFLKALSMARNRARQQGAVIQHFTTLVCDLVDLPNDLTTEPPKTDPAYYFRPFKTMLIRTVKDGGESHYVRGDHRETIPQLWSAINRPQPKGRGAGEKETET